MAREFAKSFYNSKEWIRCRASYIASVDGLCETCLKKQKLTPGKIVHHKVYITPDNINDPTVTLNHANLRLDCVDCHNDEHNPSDYEVTTKGLAFDINGDLISIV